MGIRQSAASVARRTGLVHPIRAAHVFLTPPSYPGVKLTPTRLLNLYRSRWEHRRVRTRLRSYPTLLTIEPTNVCNLRCPECFTGAGELGRDRSMLDVDFYTRVLDELGDRLFQLELYNWGEPLLHKRIYDMLKMASDRGISTIISTNFSVPFDADKAERLVASGLATLGVSLDGATQAVYEQYRRRGDIATVLENVRLINEAKKKLGRQNPAVVWEYHLFSHNLHEVEQARTMAAELGMTFAVSKGWVSGADWDPQGTYNGQFVTNPGPCSFLWEHAVIHNDGGVAPCCGTFYREDDYGAIRNVAARPARAEPTVTSSELEGRTFREVWNNGRFVKSREMFVSREKASGAKDLVCYDCPITVNWDRFKVHAAAGGTRADFQNQYVFNSGWNYFFSRRPDRAAAAPPSVAPDDIVPVTETDREPAHT
jgi:organic radical activating enzyme